MNTITEILLVVILKVCSLDFSDFQNHLGPFKKPWCLGPDLTHLTGEEPKHWRFFKSPIQFYFASRLENLCFRALGFLPPPLKPVPAHPLPDLQMHKCTVGHIPTSQDFSRWPAFIHASSEFQTSPSPSLFHKFFSILQTLASCHLLSRAFPDFCKPN